MWWRSLLVWLLIMVCETMLGTARTLVLVPRLGDLPARRVGFFVALLTIYGVTWLCVRWISGARGSGSSPTPRARSLALVGIAWAALTLAFEVGIGRMMAASQSPDGGWPRVWSRLREDYDLTHGGLMGLGLLLMAFAPWTTAYARGMLGRTSYPA